MSAASEVMRTRGVAACSVRAIADASPLTKSALHYYFSDVDEIVNLAFGSLMEQFFERIEQAARDAASPVEALWAAAETYLRFGSDRPDGRRIPLLWFDYQVTAARHGHTDVARELTERAVRLFTELTTAAGVDDPADRASILFSALIGAVVRDSMARRPTDQVLAELAVGLQLPQPIASHH